MSATSRSADMARRHSGFRRKMNTLSSLLVSCTALFSMGMLLAEPAWASALILWLRVQ